jgi:hypothetical protein
MALSYYSDLSVKPKGFDRRVTEPMQQVELQVQPDFLERLANTRPVYALSELIWNAFDAEAKDVRVIFDRDASVYFRRFAFETMATASLWGTPPDKHDPAVNL